MQTFIVASPNGAAVKVIGESCRGTRRVVAADPPQAWPEQARALGPERNIDVFFLDLAVIGRLNPAAPDEPRAALDMLREQYPVAQVIVMAPQESIRELVGLVKAGASSYLTYPLIAAEVAYVIDELAKENVRLSELDYLRDYLWREDVDQSAEVRSSAMRELMRVVGLVAPTRTTLLLGGETGTGKSFLAKQIHQLSQRADRAFISVHCGAIPDNLVESELFGHEKGAFTSAVGRQLGKFEIAQGGTIFLDEVGTLTPAAQIKLLQVLQERTFQRIGGSETIEADVRIIAASNIDLKDLCAQGHFRQDLYYRLNVFPLNLPPLRERTEDVAGLVQNFIERLNLYYGKEIAGAEPELINALVGYSWPGNIRELENLVERAYILEPGKSLGKSSFPAEIFALGRRGGRYNGDAFPGLAEVRRRGMDAIERQYLRELLTRHKGRIDASAAAAGISTRQLNKLMTKHAMDRRAFK